MIWAVAATRPPTADELADLCKACERNGVKALRVGMGEGSEAIWQHMAGLAFSPWTWPGQGRRWAVERWRTLHAAVRGRSGDAVEAMAGSTTVGLAEILVVWPGLPAPALAWVRDMGASVMTLAELRAGVSNG